MRRSILMSVTTMMGLCLMAMPVHSQTLSLSEAEALALRSDPGVLHIQAQSQALQDEAVAAAQLPDPKLKLAAMSLPVDSFDLDQEPMTQLQVGLMQMFPPGQTRALRSRQAQTRAGAMDARALDRELLVLRGVRETYVEIMAQIRMREILLETRDVLADLRELVEQYYGTGRAPQQDVYRGEVELARIEDRLVRLEQAESEARARLAMWIGNAASQPLAEGWPALEPAPSPDEILEDLPSHPAIEAYAAEIRAAEYGVDIAEEQYKAGFSVELTYGDRHGRDLSGRDLPDFLSAMLLVDLPLFRDRRQDRQLSASKHRLSAAEQARLDALRMLRREAEEQWASLEQIRNRLALFERRLLPQAGNNSQAALDAYQAAVGDLTALMRAQITEYELRLDRARLRADELKVIARLRYLEGMQ